MPIHKKRELDAIDEWVEKPKVRKSCRLCERTAYARGLCERHYQRAWREIRREMAATFMPDEQV